MKIKRPNKKHHIIISTDEEKTLDKIQYLFMINNNHHLSANWNKNFLNLTKGIYTPTAAPLPRAPSSVEKTIQRSGWEPTPLF